MGALLQTDFKGGFQMCVGGQRQNLFLKHLLFLQNKPLPLKDFLNIFGEVSLARTVFHAAFVSFESELNARTVLSSVNGNMRTSQDLILP